MSSQPSGSSFATAAPISGALTAAEVGIDAAVAIAAAVTVGVLTSSDSLGAGRAKRVSSSGKTIRSWRSLIQA